MAEESVKKVAKSNPKMLIGGLVIVVVILLGVNLFYMKKLRDAKAKESATVQPKTIEQRLNTVAPPKADVKETTEMMTVNESNAKAPMSSVKS